MRHRLALPSGAPLQRAQSLHRGDAEEAELVKQLAEACVREKRDDGEFCEARAHQVAAGGPVPDRRATQRQAAPAGFRCGSVCGSISRLGETGGIWVGDGLQTNPYGKLVWCCTMHMSGGRVLHMWVAGLFVTIDPTTHRIW